MKLKTIVTFLYLLISIPLFLFFHTSIIVWASFFVNYLFLTALTYYHLIKEPDYSPFLTSFIVFSFLFFLVAPILQISSIGSNGVFPNGFPYSTLDVVITNFLILLFNFCFFLTYIIFKKKYLKKDLNTRSAEDSYSKPLAILVLFILCLLIGVFNYDFLVDEFIRPNWMEVNQSIGSLLIRKKVLFLIPLGAIALTYRYLSEKKIITTNTTISFLILIALLVLFIVFKNPFTEKRNALGPIYISLIYLFYPKMINSNAKMFLFLFVAMILFFPLLSSLTHVDASFYEIITKPHLVKKYFIERGGILSVFNTLHYDAFANIMATVEYVTQRGYAYGYQLLSGLLFFIPRSIWETKPLSTGQVVGDYLISEHNFQFNNLSNPLVSEGYINFGIIGVVIMAVLLSYSIVKLLNWLNSTDSLKEIIAFYFAIHLMFLLRGDFTNGFAYFVGTFIGVYWIPKAIIKLLKI